MNTSLQRITAIQSTFNLIHAVEGLGNADPFSALLINGAGVIVTARAAVSDRDEPTVTCFCVAGVLDTWIIRRCADDGRSAQDTLSQPGGVLLADELSIA